MPILANKKLHLKPGSWHIMLINPDRVPNEGEVVALKLLFDNGTSEIVNFKVRKGQMMMKNHQNSK
jgi:copper(I)-binding protein